MTDFATEIGISLPLVSGYCAGRIWPSKDVATRIKKATDGDVTPDDFLNEETAA